MGPMEAAYPEELQFTEVEKTKIKYRLLRTAIERLREHDTVHSDEDMVVALAALASYEVQLLFAFGKSHLRLDLTSAA